MNMIQKGCANIAFAVVGMGAVRYFAFLKKS